MVNITFKGEPYVGTKVRLRTVEMEDVNAIMEHWNDYDSRKYLGNTIPMSTKMEEDWESWGYVTPHYKSVIEVETIIYHNCKT